MLTASSENNSFCASSHFPCLHNSASLLAISLVVIIFFFEAKEKSVLLRTYIFNGFQHFFIMRAFPVNAFAIFALPELIKIFRSVLLK
jgi:hypothetical protein